MVAGVDKSPFWESCHSQVSYSTAHLGKETFTQSPGSLRHLPEQYPKLLRFKDAQAGSSFWIPTP